MRGRKHPGVQGLYHRVTTLFSAGFEASIRGTAQAIEFVKKRIRRGGASDDDGHRKHG